MDEKPNPIKEAQIAAKKAAGELKVKREVLQKNIGATFTDGERTATVTGFQPDKMLGSVSGDAFDVNFGNPFRTDHIHCEQFLNEFKPTKGAK